MFGTISAHRVAALSTILFQIFIYIYVWLLPTIVQARCPPTYLLTNLPTYLPTYRPTYLPTYLLTYLHTFFGPHPKKILTF